MIFTLRQTFPQGITHQIQFNLDGLRNIRWENSKRLIYGSLVCFSADGFSSLLFGTIANRDAKNLKEGRIDVFFQGIPESELSLQKTYTMVESSTYFEVSYIQSDTYAYLIGRWTSGLPAHFEFSASG